jgi:replication fork protection complex subunit Tof1/Swi1
VDQFAKHYLRKLFKKLEAELTMYVELLFTKVNSTIHFLQQGYDKAAHVPRSRPAAELQIKPGEGLNHEEQIGICVGALLDDNNCSHVEWLKDILQKAVTERKL